MKMLIEIEIETTPEKVEDGEVVENPSFDVVSVKKDGQELELSDGRFNKVWTLFEMSGDGYQRTLLLDFGDD